MEANIQLINNYIEDSNIHVNELNVPEEAEMNYSIEVYISDIIREEKYLMAQIKLTHTVELEKEKQNLYAINATIVGEFKICDIIDEKKCEEILKYNGVPILSSILRAYMISVASLAGIKNVTFPIINYVDFFKEAKKEK